MPAILEISLQTARRLAVRKQLLDRSFQVSTYEATKSDILRVFHALRCIQLDPIRAVERTELLVLWSRLGNFQAQDLYDLAFTDKHLFEDWAHCASLVLMSDWPLFSLSKSSYKSHLKDASSNATRMRTWVMQNQALLQQVKRDLKEKGPLATGDFNPNVAYVPWVSSGWSSGRSIPRILEHLFDQGEVMVAGREGNRKYWALTEDFLPPHADTTTFGEHRASWEGLQMSLRALGVGIPRHIYNHFMRKAYPCWQPVLRELTDAGLHIPVNVRNTDGTLLKGDWFIHRDDMEHITSVDSATFEGRTVLLSPFDNLICDRQRTALLFNFDYTIEIYVPVAKRRYGYYVLPILMNDVFLGRVDLQMNRQESQLHIQALYLEEPWLPLTERASDLSATFQNLAAFLGARTIKLGRRMPNIWRKALRCHI